MARAYLTLSVLVVSVISLALSHQPDVPNSLKFFSGKFQSQQELWSYAIISTCLISAAPFLILFCIPLDNAGEHNALLKVLLSFASGGLLGDAFLHLIPHAINPHDHHGNDHHDNDTHHHHHHHHDDHHHHDHAGHDHTQDMVIGLWVLGGIFAFLMVEKFVRIVKGAHTHLPPKESVKDSKEPNKVDSKESEGSLRQRKKTNGNSSKNDKETTGSGSASHHGNIKVSAYLNLAADFAHNFTDGLAIGASYLAGRGVGVVTTLTILLHEVPHEIGDFAILIQSGYSKRRAMMLQLVTAVGAIGGTICGLLAEGSTTSATTWILPFTAGGFIYIATVSVIPELLENSTVWQSIKELIGICIGIGMMVLIAMYE